MRPGDWKCPKCSDIVFASKSRCRCGAAKVGGPTPPNAQVPHFKQSDWNCPNCNFLVFGSKPSCGRCGAARGTGSVASSSQTSVAPVGGKQPDWNCPSCSFLVFGSKASCGRCGAAKGATSSSQPAVTPAFGKQPDWNCPSCQDLVFGSRPACRKCGVRNPALQVATPSGSAGVQQAIGAQPQHPASMRAGDWKCSKCGDMQFGTRTICRMCATPRGAVSIFPSHWDDQDANLKLVDLAAGTPEHTKVVALFSKTMPNARVASVVRVQNKALWKRYSVEREVMQEAGNATTKSLFHGTRGTAPEMVYNGQDGFDMRFCTSGMWGIASYFAVNSSYSHSYAFRKDSQHQMFLAEVLVGNTKNYGSSSKKDLRMPPVIQGGAQSDGPAVKRYDSVTGETGGSVVHMVYANSKAYPEYLITYTDA
eukprot:TRINITY_DN4431_c0_g1_i1.p1 TRINITY_DN4431_c0_g1~~TRINITY_DN4431_c0_g1_i1.p1  ORF type:complete len:422 (+),score=84.32 TRINITY_DN4431_c0_g1_i1:44-1309(+)